MTTQSLKRKLLATLNVDAEGSIFAVKITHRILKRVYLAYKQREKLLYEYRVLSTERLYLPDFLIIGVPKAGTTWLYENLSKHPDIFVSQKKELNYFNQDFETKKLKCYSDYFKNGSKKVKGEASPGYAYLPDHRIRFIRAIMPDVRLIIMIRNPIELQWSMAFHELVRKPGLNIEVVPEAAFFDYFKNNYHHIKGGYKGIFDRWLGHFPSEQLYIGFFEDIAKQPKKLLSDVFVHIGVSRDIDWNMLPYSDIIIPPAGPKYRNSDPYRGVHDPKHSFSTSFMEKKYYDFLRDLNKVDIAEMQKTFKNRVSDWTVYKI